MPSEESTVETQQDSENKCPICGQAYDHKREEISELSRTGPQLRSDATACKSSELGTGKRQVFVHVE